MAGGAADCAFWERVLAKECRFVIYEYYSNHICYIIFILQYSECLCGVHWCFLDISRSYFSSCVCLHCIYFMRVCCAVFVIWNDKWWWWWWQWCDDCAVMQCACWILCVQCFLGCMSWGTKRGYLLLQLLNCWLTSSMATREWACRWYFNCSTLCQYCFEEKKHKQNYIIKSILFRVLHDTTGQVCFWVIFHARFYCGDICCHTKRANAAVIVAIQTACKCHHTNWFSKLKQRKSYALLRSVADLGFSRCSFPLLWFYSSLPCFLHLELLAYGSTVQRRICISDSQFSVWFSAG